MASLEFVVCDRACSGPILIEMILMLYMYRLRTYRTKVMICSHRGEWRSQRASDNNNTRVLEYSSTVLIVSNSIILEYSSTSTRVLVLVLEYSSTVLVQYSSTRVLEYSSTVLVQHSSTRVLEYSEYSSTRVRPDTATVELVQSGAFYRFCY